VAVVALPAAQAETANVPGALAGGTGHSCFFYYGAVGPSENSVGEKFANIAYPDGNAYYWGAYMRVPAGSTLKLHGQYPYARYMSLIGYNAAGSTVDGVYDESINPDPGSQNPFRAGVPRNTPNRNYTVEVVDKALPTELTNENGEKYKTSKAVHFAEEPRRPHNELYAGAPAADKEKLVNQETKKQTAEYETELVVLRIYVPNKGLGALAGVPLPEPELTLANHEVLTGQAACNALDTESKTRMEEQAANQEKPSFRLPELQSLFLNANVWKALSKPWALSKACNVAATAAESAAVGGICPNLKEPLAAAELAQEPREVEDRAAFPATETENWRGQFDRKYLLQAWTGEGANVPGSEPSKENGGIECKAAAPGCEPAKEGGGGFFPNIDNNYERDILSRTFGKVVVATGKMPTSPESYESEEAWKPSSSYQDRYTSFCMNESPRSTMVMACAYDEQVPVDAERNYTIAISRAEDKPKNAVPFCGVAWIEWNKAGDGETAEPNEEFGMLQMRTMLPNRAWPHAAQNVVHPGTERTVMGEYLPRVHYEHEASTFESSHGCAWSTPGTPQLSSGATPNGGQFTVSWTPNAHASHIAGVTYTLQHQSADGSWETVASGLPSPEYTFSAGSPETQGTWTYRVSAAGEGAESGFSGASSSVVVDRSAPPAPTAQAAREPDYAAGGWYKGAVEVTFSANGTATLPDGSAGAALSPGSLTGSQTVEGTGSHEVCGTIADVLGNVSAPGCTTVRIDDTPPSLEITCPREVELGAASPTAIVEAVDGQSGLASDPSGTVSIPTSTAGPYTVTRTAVDNVGNQTTSSCTTDVVYRFENLRPHAGLRVRPGKPVVVGFRLENAQGGDVSGASATLEIAPLAGSEAGVYRPATSASGAGDAFAPRPRGFYGYQLSTGGLSAGTWELRIRTTDGAVHTTTIQVR